MNSQVELNESTNKTEENCFDISKKLTIIGRGECGKTSIVNRFINGIFDQVKLATPIESEIYEYKMKNKSFQIKIFDTSGQDEYSRFRTLTLPISDYVLVCFSVIDQKSFSEVGDTLVYMIKQKAPENTRVILCGSKIDLRTDSSITKEEGKALAKEINALEYFECSALTGEGINEIFDYIKLDIYKQAYPKPNNVFTRMFFCCSEQE